MNSSGWDTVLARLDRDGYAVTDGALLTPMECRELSEQFDDDERFRSTMRRAARR